MTTEHPDAEEFVSLWPERLVAAGLIVGVVGLFLPWAQYSSGPIRELLNVFPTNFSGTGLEGWGILYLLACLGIAPLVFLRTFGSDAVGDFDLPVADWFVYFAGAGLMFVGATAYWDSVFAPYFGSGIHLSMLYGWFMALAGAGLVLAGSMWVRSETRDLEGG